MRETEEVRDQLDTAEWNLSVNGFDREPVTAVLEKKRRQHYLGFIYLDNSRLGAENLLFFSLPVIRQMILY